MSDEQQNDSSLTDQIRQKFHAQKLRDELHEREAAARNPEGKDIYEKLMAYARDAKPSWSGKPSAAQTNTYGSPGNIPKSIAPSRQSPASEARNPKSGVDGGMIDFVACKDNGDGTFTQGTVSAVATFHI